MSLLGSGAFPVPRHLGFRLIVERELMALLERGNCVSNIFHVLPLLYVL
jgi:hypothetical protein